MTEGTFKIGVATYPDDRLSLEDLLLKADGEAL